MLQNHIVDLTALSCFRVFSQPLLCLGKSNTLCVRGPQGETKGSLKSQAGLNYKPHQRDAEGNLERDSHGGAALHLGHLLDFGVVFFSRWTLLSRAEKHSCLLSSLWRERKPSSGDSTSGPYRELSWDWTMGAQGAQGQRSGRGCSSGGIVTQPLRSTYSVLTELGSGAIININHRLST